MKSISIIGTVGVPARYGGFETLADNLVKFNAKEEPLCKLSVYCSGSEGPESYNTANLRYINLGANGVSSILYDVVSLLSAIKHKDDVILLLGVSGAIALPIIRLLSKVRIVTNIDGVEWKREKWRGLAKFFLRYSERVAVNFSDSVIADNFGIAEHLRREYSSPCEVITYGGDQGLHARAKPYEGVLPDKYILGLCRIEPENNVEMILEAFSRNNKLHLVFIGNWSSSSYGESLHKRYADIQNIHLLSPIYNDGVLKTIRSGAYAYVHGHSAGGTNPSLVEMMHFGMTIFAFDCIFNRYTTDQQAVYFHSCEELINKLENISDDEVVFGNVMKKIANENYTWEKIARQYFELLLR